MSKRRKSTTGKPSKSMEILYILPPLIAIVIVPLIVRLKVIDMPQANLVWASKETVKTADLFAYYKGIVLIAAALLALIIMIRTFRDKWTFTGDKRLFLLFGYLVILLLSYIFSINRDVALIGYKERFEGVIVCVAYIILFLYTAFHTDDEEKFRRIIKAWSVTSIIIFFIGLFQFLGKDFFTSSLGYFLTVPDEFRGLPLHGDKDAVRNVYQTLYHYNYVSFYAALGFPFFLTLALTEKQKALKAILYILTLLFAINQVISLSRNGYIGILAAFAFVLIFIREKFIRYWKILLPLGAVTAALCLAFLFVSDSVTATRIRTGFTNMLRAEDKKIELIADGDTLDVNYLNQKFSIVAVTGIDESPFILKDSSDNTVQPDGYSNETTYTLDNVNGVKFKLGYMNNLSTIIMMTEGKNWYLTYTEDRFHYHNPNMTISPIEKAPSFGFEGRETFASSRGYIWSRTFPLVFSNGIFGSGPDTFPLVFPQNEYDAKFNAYTTQYTVVDKPHSIYLDYASNTGLISLLLLLVFWGFYIVDCFRLYFRTDIYSFYPRIGIACLVAVIGYLASGIFNDTNVSVTPTFWIILALGYSANRIVAAKQHR